MGDSLSDDPAIAVVAPHAGYVYSGGIAAEVYRSVRVPDTAVVLCPNHTGIGPQTAIMCRGTWQIPGHAVPVAEKLARKLQQRAGIQEDASAHRNEHSLEVHLPFLVHRNPRLAIVPVCLARLSFERCAEIGEALAEVILPQKDQVLIVASTDMSHQLPAEAAERLDRMALERVQQRDARGLFDTVVENRISMCGFIPTAIAIAAANRLGATQARLIRYGNSGEASGDYESVVGYAGLVIQ